MKNMKKILALVVAALLVLSMVSAFADDPVTYSVTVTKDSTDKAAHTYGAYQLFKGKLETVNSKKVLSDIQWGDNIDTSKIATLISDLNAIGGITLASGATASQAAKAISDANLTADSTEAQAVADAFNKALSDDAKSSVNIAATATSGSITGLPAGYYLIKDTAAVSGEGAKTRFILEVVDDVSVTEKANVPSVEKKVQAEDGKWQDAADYDIGDTIPYKVTGTLPGKFAEFDTYKTYTITDTLSSGLTAPAQADVKITLDTIDGTDLSSIFDITVTGQVIKAQLKSGVDLKTARVGDPEVGFSATSKIILSYSAVLNENAVIGSNGNDNTVHIEFSNNPNYDGDGDKGTTPDDKVVVFTYDIKALKVEPTSDAAIDQTAYEALTNEQKADYVKVGDKWQKTQALSGAGFTLYKETAADTWTKIGNEITGVTTFEFKGTDAGKYKLVETTVPAGYNKADDVIITVSATYDTEAAEPKLKSLTVEPATAGFTVTTTTIANDETHITTDGIISGKILNQSGSTLPSTGGIGTTIFYVAGSILVLAAVILLVTKRRMGTND